jgi:hypothetical protein
VDPFPASDPPAPLEMKRRPGAAWHGEEIHGDFKMEFIVGVCVHIYIYLYRMTWDFIGFGFFYFYKNDGVLSAGWGENIKYVHQKLHFS